MRKKKTDQTKAVKPIQPELVEETLEDEESEPDLDIIDNPEELVLDDDIGLGKESLKEGISTSAVPVTGALQRYLQEINRYPMLTREEEKALAIRLYDGNDPDAAAALITSNLRLVVKIAMDFHRYWMRSLMDLIQEGNIGLMQAVKKFDPYKDIKLSYYASFWIKAYILKFIMDNWKLVRIGTTQAQRKLFFNLNKEKEKLLAKGIDPSPQLLAHNLNVKESDILEMDQRLSGWELSLDAPVREDSEDDHKSFLPSIGESLDDQVARQEMHRLLRENLQEFRKTLSGKELYIFDHRLLTEESVTLQDIGSKFKITRERVRQIQDRLINKIREFIRSKFPDMEVDQFGANGAGRAEVGE
ncbi:MAG: RNA polymerase factor sigma-32 [Deltaproteobacteria bacterium]|nr:RNA polymerase factor sigma-32 [Deltaproteobacteria bacterium]